MDDDIASDRSRSVKSKANFTSLRGQPAALNYDSAPVRPVSARTLKNSLSLDSVSLFNSTLHGNREEQVPGSSSSGNAPAGHLPSAFPRPANTLADSPRIMSGMDATSRPGSALSTARSLSSNGRALQMTLSQQMRLQRITGDPSSPRGSLTHRGSMGGSTKALVGPIAERQTGDADRALQPRRSNEPDVNLLGAEPGLMGTVIDTSDMRAFLMRPGPSYGGSIRCLVKRERTSSKMFPKYTLFLEGSHTFLMAACPRKNLLGEMKINSAANYIMSTDQQDLNRASESYFGKVRSNYLGTEFTLYDDGPSPKRSRDDQLSRQELGAVTYQYNVMGTRGPRKMVALVPALDAESKPLTFRASARNERAILARYQKNEEPHRMVALVNKPPKWNAQLGAYCLNFSGRVTHASVKNFQLVTTGDMDTVILQFGKIGTDIFTMDYKAPLSAMQAFGICLTSLDNKVACE